MFLTILDRSRSRAQKDSHVADPPSAAADAGVHGDRVARGPLRPDRLTPVRERLSGPALVSRFKVIDQCVIFMMSVLAAVLAHPYPTLSSPIAQALPVASGMAASLISLKVLKVYRFSRLERIDDHLLRVAAAVFIGGACARLSTLIPGVRVTAVIGAWTILTLAGLIAAHGWTWAYVAQARRQGRLTPNIVIVGATENAATMIDQALHARHLQILGIFDDRMERVSSKLKGVPVLGRVADLPDHRIMPFVDRVVIALPPTADARVSQIVEALRRIPNAVTLFVDMQADAAAAALERMADAPLEDQGATIDTHSGAGAKRVVDLLGSLAALIMLAPLLAAIAVAVKLTSPGPALFRQIRHGFNNEPITVLKFRSMRIECSDATAAQQVRAGDSRVTPVGRFIRKTSLDELPQLFNVLMGEMSLVGPRPHAIGMKTGDTESAQLVAEYAWRHRMKPGITGWAQINGSRGPVDTEAAVRERVTLDVEYIERQSFWLDLYIIIVTIPRLLGDSQAIR